ncbi:MAG: hypothetical protein GC137_04255 [Alphaproteobacteria bacterium]|nr:hypothetical protein [Alphaproteobacteria bacterium]
MGYNTVISLKISELERIARDRKFGQELGRAVSASSLTEDRKAKLVVGGFEVGEVLETYHESHGHQIHVDAEDGDCALVLIYNDSLTFILEDEAFGARLVQSIAETVGPDQDTLRGSFSARSAHPRLAQISSAGKVIGFQSAGQETDLDVGGNTASVVEPG